MYFSENSSQEGEEESAADGERSHQRTLQGCVIYSSCLQVVLQLDEDDAERVDDPEDNSIDNEGAEHDQPGLTTTIRWIHQLRHFYNSLCCLHCSSGFTDGILVLLVSRHV